MSKIALEGNALGSGTFTIAAPNSNSNPTLTLPTSSGTVVVTGGAQTIEFAAGSAAAPSITFTGDTNTGIFSPGADTIAFTEGGAEAMRIDSSGNVGIGTSSPTASASNKTVTINGPSGSGALIDFKSNETLNFRIFSGSASSVLSVKTATPLIFDTNDTERMRIDSSGNVGIGTSSVGIFGQSAGKLLNVVASSNYAFLQLQGASGNGGAIDFGDTSVRHAEIASLSGSALAFYTNATNSGNALTERMRITSGGNVLIGQTSASSSSFLLNCVGGGILTTRVNIGDLGGFSDGSTLYLGSDSTNSSSWNQSNANYRFGSNRGGCVVAINPGGYTYEGGSGTGTRTFAVNSNGNVQNTNNSYGSLSDAKLKENIVDASPKLDDLMKVKIRNFNLIADESKTKQIGVIAQELEEVFPRMIEEHIDYTYEDYVNEYGNNDKKAIPTGTVTKEVKYSVFVPMLIKAVQELKAELDATKAEVAALKGQ